MASVILESISKRYRGNVHAVRDLSLSVADGEILVLVGPSGCGKTTTLRLIAGLEATDSGRVIIGDRDVTRIEPGGRNVAMVFQDHALYPHMTGRKNLAFPLRMQKLPRKMIEQRIAEAAEMVGVTDLLDRKPATLSGGEHQRVALARAVARQPACMLLDEPLSNLDAQLRVRMRSELRQLKQRAGITMIHVTHDQEEAMALADTLAVMKAGEIRQIGPPRAIYAKPADRFVAGFLGSPAMNFIDGTIKRAGGGARFVDRGDVCVPLDSETYRTVIAQEAPAIVLGIRPTALRPSLSGQGSAQDGTIVIRVMSVQPLGESTDVVGQTTAGDEVTARLPAEVKPAPGEQIELAFDRAAMHFFAIGPDGARIDSGSPARPPNLSGTVRL